MSISIPPAKKTTANSTESTTVGLEDATNARTWLESLSPEECAAALSFRDGPFLTNLLQLVSSSSSTQQQQPQQQPLWETIATIDNLDDDDKMSIHEKEWEQSILVRERFSDEKTMMKVEDSNKSEDLPGRQLAKNQEREQTVALVTTIPLDKSNNLSQSIQEEEEKPKEEAEVFRIRDDQEEEESGTMTTPGKGTTKWTDKQSDNQEEALLAKAAKEMAENIRVIAPAAADLGGDIPFVTIQPAFLKGTTDGSCSLRGLDHILQAFSPSSSFLSDDFIPKEYLNNKTKGSPAIEKLCLQRVQSLIKSASDSNAPILLLLILLVRIEVAAFLAFGESKKGHHHHHHHHHKGGKNKKMEKQHMEVLVKRLDALEKKSISLDPSSLQTIVAPLTKAGYCSLEGSSSTDHVKLENLLVLPFPTLIKLLTSTTQASNRPTFASWTKAWNATIHYLLEFSKSPPTPTPPSTITPTAVQKTNTPAPTTPNPTKSNTVTPEKAPEDNNDNDKTPEGEGTASTTPASTNSTKKKKKKKKNRKRKNNNNNNNNNNNGDASSPKNNQPNLEPAANETNDKDVNEEAEKTANANNEKQVPSQDSKEPAEETKKIVATAAPSKEQNAKPKAGGGKKSDQKSNDETETKPSVKAVKDSEKLLATTPDETEDESRHDEMEEEVVVKPTTGKPANDKGDFSVSRVHGVGTVVVAPSTTATTMQPSNASEASNQKPVGEITTKGEAEATDDNHDEWETVEVKGRGNRKKASRGNAQQQSGMNQNGANSPQKKSKATRTAATRKRAANRKMVKDILSGVLDSVDEEIRRRRQQEARSAKTVAKAPAVPAPSPAPVQSAWKDGSRTPGITTDGSKKEKTTLRDVVAGKKAVATPAKKSGAAKGSGKPAAQSPPPPARSNQKTGGNASPMKGAKGQSADQNTAPTIPETVSERAAPRVGRDITRSDSSSTETDDKQKKEEQASIPSQVDKLSSPEPPLPTLLNPGNVNSASSSVASSLEAPHAGRGHHHTSTSNEVDVGYHLLDVCDRLTRDMHVFMTRRANALHARRRERGALLGALQDSVSAIWNGHSHVELYGSCATMLDLPSSDLDVVVCGLDPMDAMSSQPNMPSFGRSMSESVTGGETMNSDAQHRHSMPHYVPMHLNAERVIRLASELERQPWAVHVKAIPTASVPVVKVLADPTRLPGAVPPSVMEGEEWIMQHHHAAAQTTAGGSSPPPPSDFSSADPSQAGSPHYQPVMSPVWRGADVINGLLQVDITFEGPEHGGIGSTDFSARVVQNVCDETGLPAESTAFVQVIMVIKELLAQRRLNEPFSGGLSSYALLLLVLAVMCERKVVREELDRVERQRRVVAFGGGNREIKVSSALSVELAEGPKHATELSKTKGQHPATSVSKANAKASKSDSKGSNSQPQKSQSSTSKSGGKGVGMPTSVNAPTNENDNNKGSVTNNQGGKQSSKGQPQTAAQIAKQTSKNSPQPNPQGAKQGAKGAGKANAQNAKQAPKSAAQVTLQGQGPKPSAKSPQQTTAQGGKQTKNVQQAEKRQQGNQQQGGKAGNTSLKGNAAANQQRRNSGGGNQQRRASAGGNQPRAGSAGKGNHQMSEKGGSPASSEKKPAKSPGNSWASIAMGKNKSGASKGGSPGKDQGAQKKTAQPTKPSSFADAVARNTGNAKGMAASAAAAVKASSAAAVAKPKQANGVTSAGQGEQASKKVNQKQQASPTTTKAEEGTKTPPQNRTKSADVVSHPAAEQKGEDAVSDQTAEVENEKERKIEADEKTSKFNNYSSEPTVEPAISSAQSAFPQGFNDVIEVLCSGETTPGKLLMHFLLFYGQHFEAHQTAIDISGKHHREIASQSPPYTILSPYIQRKSAGVIDPVTGMLTVDPIVVYDPLEGAENNNVARRCFLWSSVKWVFAQSYMTLSSAAERNTTPPGTPGAGTKDVAAATNTKGNGKQGHDATSENGAWNGPYNPTDKGTLFDPSSPLLELLLSF